MSLCSLCAGRVAAPLFQSTRAFSVTSSLHRKPRWLPKAPSKIFRVPARPVVSDEERAFRLRVHNHYRTQMKSLSAYLRADWQRRQQDRAQPGHLLSPEQEEAEHRQLMQLNDAENARLAELRRRRLQQREQEMRERAQRQLAAAEQQRERDRSAAVQTIAAQEEVSKQYIARDQLQQAIEAALATEVDYNFAIDAQGNRIEGRTTPPP